MEKPSLKLDNIPEIIKEAAKSTLGIFALMIIVIGILAFYFFKKSGDKVKVAIFILLLIGVACFGVSIQRTNNTITKEKNDVTRPVVRQDESKQNPPKPGRQPKQTGESLHTQVLTIVINADYENATLYIDGVVSAPESTTLNSITISLQKGTHTITLKKDDKEFTKIINIVSGHNAQLIVE